MRPGNPFGGSNSVNAARQAAIRQAALNLMNAARTLSQLTNTLAGISSSAASATATEAQIRQFSSTLGGYPTRINTNANQLQQAIADYLNAAGGN